MKITLSAAAGLALLAASAASPVQAAPPPPPPGAVQITDVQLGPKTANFVVRFTPAPIDATRVYPTYQFSVAPKFCTFSAPAGPGTFPTQSYAGGPYQVSLQCACNRPYYAMVSTAAPDAYTPRSRWVESAKVNMPCTK